jgi:uncharacterized oxidoreductase
VTYHVLRANRASHEEASIVAEHLIGANLAGHDSHGIILLPTYVERIAKGHIVPGASLEILDETPTTFRADGHWGFGYVISTRAMEKVIQKAKDQNIAAAVVFRQGHVGRLANYPLLAVREGLIGFMTADSGRSPKAVAPFGGRARRLGTNPLCMAFPSDTPSPVFIDMATSAVAAGKLQVAVARHEEIPDSWLVAKDGSRTTDPQEYAAGGAILPLGGREGHKGYGLSVMVETLSGLLTGIGFGDDPQGPHNDGCFLMAVKVEAFRPLAQFRREMAEFVAYLKATPPATGFQEILYPGEVEHRTEQQRIRDGILVEEATWQQVWALVTTHGLEGTVGGGER